MHVTNEIIHTAYEFYVTSFNKFDLGVALFADDLERETWNMLTEDEFRAKVFQFEDRFDELVEIGPINKGIWLQFKYPNGYGASVVWHIFSIGRENGLWELAVLDKDENIDCSTSVANDIVGNLTPDGVKELLNKIKNLEAK